MTDTVGAIASLTVGATGDTTFVGKILTLDVARSIPSIDRTPLDRTSGGMTFEKGRLESWTMSGTMIFDPGDTVPLGTKGQTILTWADATGSTLTWSTGFMTDHSVSVVHEEGMEASFTMTLCGAAS